MYSVVFECLRVSRLPILDLGCGIGILLYYLGHRSLYLRMILKTAVKVSGGSSF